MQLRASIPPALLNAAVAALQQHVPELSPSTLVAALREHGEQRAPVIERAFYTLREYATIVGLSAHGAKLQAQRGAIPAVKVGPRVWRVPVAYVRQLLSAGTQDTTASEAAVEAVSA